MVSPPKYPAHILHSVAKRCVLYLPVITESFVIKDFGHFSVSSKCAEALNEIFDFNEMEDSNLILVG